MAPQCRNVLKAQVVSSPWLGEIKQIPVQIPARGHPYWSLGAEMPSAVLGPGTSSALRAWDLRGCPWTAGDAEIQLHADKLFCVPLRSSTPPHLQKFCLCANSAQMVFVDRLWGVAQLHGSLQP